ncbi:MAG: DUF4102 domain-containing protein, partial [Gammaproteobacteria bacterium]|nr:DUF4102 domain-containing protein [Gammaproteobacteria bacterium]
MKAKLTARKCQTIKAPGWHKVATTLYLVVSINRNTGTVRKSWVQKLRVAGKPQTYGLGSFEDVTLTEAKQAATLRRAAVLK